MKISEHWLREWVDPKGTTMELAERLTLAGFEVESVAPCAPELRGVVVGRVREVRPHPQAARLRICDVDAGAGEAIQVVCGASDVAAGGCYALALPETELADGRRISATRIHGVESRGMLCSGAELGLNDDPDRLLQLDDDAKPGAAVAAVLALDDRVIELAVTPNRGDCLCVAGIAREVAALYGRELRVPDIRPAPVLHARRREVTLADPDGCPRYAGRIIEQVDVQRRTPLWLAERLRRADLRSVNIIVDITNFVMIELGQPMHAFDDDKLHGGIVVRFARTGESLRLLNGHECRLDANALLVADESGPAALAGVMGGAASAISADSRGLFLESAYFTPACISASARRLALHTDASQRFERGVDPELQIRAIERATELILRFCGGRAGAVIDARTVGFPPPRRRVHLRSSRLRTLLGARIGKGRVETDLRNLGLAVTPIKGGWETEIPPHRPDLSLEADLIEEVARLYGYERIPSARLAGRLGMHMGRPELRFRAWRRILVERGYFEAMTYSFVDGDLQRRVLGETRPIPLLNPISADLGVLRCSLLPGLLQAAQFNRLRQQARVRLFELGRVFLPEPQLQQPYRLAGVALGNTLPEQWDRGRNAGDFFDIKGDVEALVRVSERPERVRYRELQHPLLHPGQCAEISINNQCVGIVGAVHPGVQEALDLSGPAYLFELQVDRLARGKHAEFSAYSRFPSVRRDLAVVVDRSVSVGGLLSAVEGAGTPLLHNLELFDVYEGEGIDLGKKSLALGLTFQKSSSTLIEHEVEAALGRILAVLKEKYGGTLRQ